MNQKEENKEPQQDLDFSIDFNDPRLQPDYFKSGEMEKTREEEKAKRKELEGKIDKIINAPRFYYYHNEEQKKTVTVIDEESEKPEGESWVCTTEFRPTPEDRAFKLWDLVKEDYKAFEYLVSRYSDACTSLITSILSIQSCLIPQNELINPYTFDDCIERGKELVKDIERLYEDRNDYLENWLGNGAVDEMEEKYNKKKEDRLK